MGITSDNEASDRLGNNIGNCLSSPLLMTSMSLVAGVVLLGVQLVAVAQLPPAAWFQVYVVCPWAVTSPVINSAAIISCFTAYNFFEGSDNNWLPLT